MESFWPLLRRNYPNGVVFMDFNPIQPGQIRQNSQFDLQNTPLIHAPQMRYVTGGNLLDKPTFGQQFLAGLRKFGSIFLKLAGGISRFFGPIGMAASGGMYGISNILDKAEANSQFKQRIRQQAEASAVSVSRYPGMTPGYGPVAQTGGVTEADRLNTVVNREVAAYDQIQRFN